LLATLQQDTTKTIKELYIMSNRQVFFVPGREGIIDYAIQRDGVLVSEYAGKSLADLASEYPGVEVGDLATAYAGQQEAWKTAPALVTRERFIEMLEVLPPEDWARKEGSESFKLCEYQTGNITRIFARIGKKYYEFMDDARLSHESILEKIEATSRIKDAPVLN
jgi:hypothetical protein